MVNSYPACTKSDNSPLFISCSSCYYTARWTVPTFLLTSWMLQCGSCYYTVRWTDPTFLLKSWMLQSPGPHYTADRTVYHCIK